MEMELKEGIINDDFARYLRSGTNPAKRDIAAFMAWEEGRITIGRCIDLWRHNNEIRQQVGNKKKFIAWLNSLGYIRNLK